MLNKKKTKKQKNGRNNIKPFCRRQWQGGWGEAISKNDGMVMCGGLKYIF